MNQTMNWDTEYLDDLDDLLVDFLPTNESDPLFIFQDDNSNEDLLELDHVSPATNPSEELNLICGVCGAPAHGYNFDQITCESCKAFFRRNALKHMPDLKCRYSGSCVINIQTRRQCTHCRLKKCFDIKMRKDWIRTDEERELRQLQKLAKEQKKLHKQPNEQDSLSNLALVSRKKKRLMIKSQDGLTQSIFRLTHFSPIQSLLDDDRILLNNITNAYQIGAETADCSHINKYNEITTTLVEFINDESIVHQSLIYLYKSIPEFRQLNLDDQILLIKSNLHMIIHLHHIIIDNFRDNDKIGQLMTNWIDGDFHRQMFRTRHYFYRFINYPLILKLTLIIFIFNINLPIKIQIFMNEKNYSTININILLFFGDMFIISIPKKKPFK